jgi:signal peptidase II
MTRTRIYLVAAVTAALGLIADQASKWALVKIMGMHEFSRIRIWSIFDLVLWPNYGTSFSLFRTGNPYVFSLLALVIVGFLVLWLSRMMSPILAAAIGAVIGGALGNVVDRLRIGFVVDFLYFHLGDYGWPAFNIADSLIVVGIGVLVFDGMFLSHKTDKMARRKQP